MLRPSLAGKRRGAGLQRRPAGVDPGYCGLVKSLRGGAGRRGWLLSLFRLALNSFGESNKKRQAGFLPRAAKPPKEA